MIVSVISRSSANVISIYFVIVSWRHHSLFHILLRELVVVKDVDDDRIVFRAAYSRISRWQI
jgi:hypothetical protein